MAKGDRDRIHFRKVENADGSTTLHARITVPEKVAGKIVWRRIERSTRTSDPRKAQKVAERIKEDEYKRAYSDEPEQKDERTFAEAAVSYLKAGGDGLYMVPILASIGKTPISDITQDTIYALAEEIYPGRAAATINRQVFTPIVSVLHSAENATFRSPRVMRPKGWLPKSNFKRPPRDWWARVLPECSPNLAAFVLFVRLHLRRTSEACQIKPQDIDGETWRVTVQDTKEDQEIVFKLAAPVIEQLERYPWRLNQYVFGFSSKSRVYPALREACKRAGVPYHVPKDAGRHSGATYLLEQGRTLAEVKEAGRWATSKMPDLIYGHLERSRVDDDVRELGEKWHEEMGKKGEVISPVFGEHAGKKK